MRPRAVPHLRRGQGLDPRAARLTVDVRAKVDPKLVRSLARRLRRAMRAARVGGEVALSLVGDREIRALNRAFAGEDHATDVLSFEQHPPLAGDIVISVETAARQAKQPLADELLHLAVHGLAHLCGYDHATRRDEAIMFGWETKLREQARGRTRVKAIARPSRRA